MREIQLGPIYVLIDAEELLDKQDIEDALARHRRGDWAEATLWDRIANLPFLRVCRSVISKHTDRNGTPFLILTVFDEEEEENPQTHICIDRRR